MIKEISTEIFRNSQFDLDKIVIDTVNKLVKAHNSQEELTETEITIHILRNWDRTKIVNFCKHLLGDTCQNCKEIQ